MSINDIICDATLVVLGLAMVAIFLILTISAAKAPKESNDEPSKEKIKPIPEQSLPIMDQFEYGRNQLEFIDAVVNTLIEIKIANHVILGQTYTSLHIDKDIEDLAKEAMTAFQAKFYDPEKSVYTKEYLYKYLIEKCKIGLINASRKDI